MTTSAPAHLRRPRTAVPSGPTRPWRGVTLVLDAPDADDAAIVEMADVLLDLARELIPEAAARTHVTLGGAADEPPAPAPQLRVVPGERR